MKKICIYFIVLIVFIFLDSCKDNGPWTPPFYIAVGTVIGKESCHVDEDEDYWLISIHSSPSKRQDYGDKLVIDGVGYTNVIKVTELDGKLKIIGQKVGFDFYIDDETAYLTTGCEVTDPVVYKLKLARIKTSGPAVF